MVGMAKTSTHDVTKRDPPSVFTRSKMETASEDTLKLSGPLLLLVSMLVTVMRCCSTCLAAVTSQTNKQEKRYAVIVVMDLILKEVIKVSYVHIMNHLMVIINAYHGQINLVMESQLMQMV